MNITLYYAFDRSVTPGVLSFVVLGQGGARLIFPLLIICSFVVKNFLKLFLPPCFTIAKMAVAGVLTGHADVHFFYIITKSGAIPTKSAPYTGREWTYTALIRHCAREWV